MPHIEIEPTPTPGEADPQDPISFTLAGQHFNCLPPPMPFGAIVDLLHLADISDPMVMARNAYQVEAFVLGTLRDDDAEYVDDPMRPDGRRLVKADSTARFRALRSDKAHRAGPLDLAHLALKLFPIYMGVPTQPESPSQPGSSPVNGTSGPAFANLASNGAPSGETPPPSSTGPTSS